MNMSACKQGLHMDTSNKGHLDTVRVSGNYPDILLQSVNA